MPELFDENQDLFRCFTLCASQLRAGFSGAYALDWNVVMRVADDLGIVTDETFYGMLQHFEHAMLNTMNKASSKKQVNNG